MKLLSSSSPGAALSDLTTGTVNDTETEAEHPCSNINISKFPSEPPLIKTAISHQTPSPFLPQHVSLNSIHTPISRYSIHGEFGAADNKTRESRPKVAEILAHTSYPDTIWNLTPTQRGQLPVAATRGGPFKIDWEVHGKGDIKLVVSMLSLGAEQTRASERYERAARDGS